MSKLLHSIRYLPNMSVTEQTELFKIAMHAQIVDFIRYSKKLWLADGQLKLFI